MRMEQASALEPSGTVGAALKPFRSKGSAHWAFENISQTCRHSEIVANKSADDRKYAVESVQRCNREIQNLEQLLQKQDAEVQRIEELQNTCNMTWKSSMLPGANVDRKLGVGSYVRIVAKGQDNHRLGIVEEDHRTSSTLLLVKLFGESDRKGWFTDRDVVIVPSVKEWQDHVGELLELSYVERQKTLHELTRVSEHRGEYDRALSEAEKLVSPTRVALKEAKRKLCDLSAFATKAVLAIRVRLRPGVGKPKAWRDLGAHVSCDWVVKFGDGDKVRLLSGTDAIELCKAVMSAGLSRTSHEDVLLARRRFRNVDCASAEEFAITLGLKEAERIFDSMRAGAPRPGPLRSISILKGCLGGVSDMVVDTSVRDFFENVDSGVIRTKAVVPPAELRATLRPYQVRGFQWLVSNASNGFGCILADDMGLGKTLQTIAFILHQKSQGALEHPALIVAPKGLLGNWSREIKAWAPMLIVHTHYGIQRSFSMPSSAARKRSWSGQFRDECQTPTRKGAIEEGFLGDFATPSKLANASSTDGNFVMKDANTSFGADVILTSYGMVRRDVDEFVQMRQFSGMILDEAQLIKNYSSQTSIAVKRVAEVAGTVRIALSGTPVENRLSDLHSLFEFILPGYLANSRSEFDRTFARPLAAEMAAKKLAVVQKQCSGNIEGASQQQEVLRRLIQPFVLRRLKTDASVAPDLPSKIEIDHLCDLSDKQAALYDALQRSTLKSIADNAISPFMRQRHILGMIHAFREVCNHPATLKSERRPAGFDVVNCCRTDVQASGKCIELHRILDDIISSDEKVVIFCQYIETIDMLAEQISSRQGCDVLKYTGASTLEERENIVAAFQQKHDVRVLLLSLQAGGVGLTLTAAAHVIHFDRCYNPAKENQATDRVHRIGQTKTVCVHRLAAKDTFEERLAEIMSKKQGLSDLTVQASESWLADMDDDELRSLFSLSENACREDDINDSTASSQKRRRS